MAQKTSPPNLCPLTRSKPKREVANKTTAAIQDNFPAGLARPALRALASAGYTKLEQLTKTSETDLLELHGMGPNAMRLLQAALRAKGLSFGG